MWIMLKQENITCLHSVCKVKIHTFFFLLSVQRRDFDAFSLCRSQLNANCQGADKAVLTQSNTVVGAKLVYDGDKKRSFQVNKEIFSLFAKVCCLSTTDIPITTTESLSLFLFPCMFSHKSCVCSHVGIIHAQGSTTQFIFGRRFTIRLETSCTAFTLCGLDKREHLSSGSERIVMKMSKEGGRLSDLFRGPLELQSDALRLNNIPLNIGPVTYTKHAVTMFLAQSSGCEVF